MTGGFGPNGELGVPARFVERGELAVGLELTNRSAGPLRILGVRALDPPNAFARQIGSALRPKPVCPPRVYGCGALLLRPSLPWEPYGATKPAAVEVAPGATVQAQLNFALGSCADREGAASAAAQTGEVSYVDAQGAPGTQLVPLPHFAAVVPSAAACRVRPHSQLAIDGNAFVGTNTNKTVPGTARSTCTQPAGGVLRCSDGDVCTRTGAGLGFRSGLLFSWGDVKLQ